MGSPVLPPPTVVHVPLDPLLSMRVLAPAPVGIVIGDARVPAPHERCPFCGVAPSGAWSEHVLGCDSPTKESFQ